MTFASGQRWEKLGAMAAIGALALASVTQAAVMVYKLGELTERVDSIKQTTDLLLKSALQTRASGEQIK